VAVEAAGRGVAVVTGASSGIGAACAGALVREGFSVVLGARRIERVAALAAQLGGTGMARAHRLDVSDTASVEEFCAAVGPDCRLLVNNAGGALGLDPIADADEDKWRRMYESNVLGTLRMTRGLLDRLVASGDGMVINIGSVAGFEPYAGGAGYNAAKHALRALTDVLRIELNGKPVRVSEIDPGMVETEFSLVRFGGDAERASSVYSGVTPLTAEDIAEIVGFVATRPPHVDIDQVVVRPRDQARVWLVNRSGSGG
jgi:NADP-dependent 3-hydroxy acid dehydrogenase YdfG